MQLLLDGDQILSWMPDLDILRMARDWSNALGFSSRPGGLWSGNDGRILKSAAGSCDNKRVIDGWLTALPHRGAASFAYWLKGAIAGTVGLR